MRTFIRTLLVVWLMSATTAVFAQKGQESVERAFEKALSMMQKEGYITDTEVLSFKDGAYFRDYVFTIPKSKKKAIDAISKVLNVNGSSAYQVMVKSVGSSSKQQSKVVYGNYNDHSKMYGDKNDRNYSLLFFRDEHNSTKRYVYALVWYPTEDGRISGCLDRIYGVDPQAPQESKRFSRWNMPQVKDFQYNEEETRKKWEEMEKNRKQWMEEMERNFKVAPKTNTEFLMQFNNYRMSFKNVNEFLNNAGVKQVKANKTTIQNVIANRLMKLCNNNMQLLNADEKKFCTNTLLKMKKETDDEEVKGMLDLTVRNLQKK